MCDHVGQKCIAGDIEGHPEAHVTWALVQMTRQLTVAHIELTQSVAGWQSHGWQVCGRQRALLHRQNTTVETWSHLSCVTFGVPGTQDDPPVLWIRFDGVDDLLQLVDTLSCIICKGVSHLNTRVCNRWKTMRSKIKWMWKTYLRAYLCTRHQSASTGNRTRGPGHPPLCRWTPDCPGTPWNHWHPKSLLLSLRALWHLWIPVATPKLPINVLATLQILHLSFERLHFWITDFKQGTMLLNLPW